MANPRGIPTYVFVGTYTQNLAHVEAKAEGIYTYRFEPSTGALRLAHVAKGAVNPSYVELDPTERYLYATNELNELDGEIGGGASAYAIDKATGALTFLNQRHTRGGAPCHAFVDATGKYVMVTNYEGGSVAMYPVGAEGQLGEASDFIQHVGSSVLPRQSHARAHSINIDANNRFALVCDLGLDKVMVYRLDLQKGKLVPNDPPSAPLAPAAGPRHLAFHPNGRVVYVINEIASTLTTFTYDAARGTLTEIQTVSTLPEGFDGRNSTADLHVHPNGKFVYGSNRGHNSLAIFAVDAASGALTLIGHESTRGSTPRNFAIDPTGTFVIAANQSSSNVTSYRIDPEKGTLTVLAETEVPTPVCVKFAYLS